MQKLGLELRNARLEVVDAEPAPAHERAHARAADRLSSPAIEARGRQGVGASLKHFAANNTETDRMRSSSNVDPRALREIYLRGFQRVVRDAAPWTVMCSYNRVNGVHAAENHWLLTEVLRDEWGFDGFVVSDWFATRSTAESAKAGLSLEMPGPGNWYGKKLGEAVREGELDEASLDRIAGDVLRVYERTGVLDGTGSAEEQTLDRPEDRALNRGAAAAGRGCAPPPAP